MILVRRKALRTLRGMKLFVFGRVRSEFERTTQLIMNHFGAQEGVAHPTRDEMIYVW
jgi:hypothetical protein